MSSAQRYHAMPRKAAADIAVGRGVMSTVGRSALSIPEVVLSLIVKVDACRSERGKGPKRWV